MCVWFLKYIYIYIYILATYSSISEHQTGSCRFGFQMQTSIGIRACGRYCIRVTNDCTAPKLASRARKKRIFQKMVVVWCVSNSFLCM